MLESDFATYERALSRLDDPDGVLGSEGVVFPAVRDFGYDSTPINSVTFGAMGCDGVHYAVLTRDGIVQDDCPVIQICPMDFDDLYQVKAATFRQFLADACGVPLPELDVVFAAERAGVPTLADFLKSHFDIARLWNDERTRQFDQFRALIVPKNSDPG